ncbi:hypothetical protein MXB_5298 [Myxobolus squamalis]|nr:hypothetical protein MXB_5298 [Myxobolus squamalis]
MALFTDTCAMWLLAAHALFQINSPVVTIYSTLSNDNIVFGLNLLEVKGILVDKKCMPRLIETIDQIPSIETIFCTEKFPYDMSKANLPKSRVVKVIQLESLNLKQELKIDDLERLKLLKPQAKDVALYMFTSGSTGKPKAVIITHENIVSAVSVAIPKEFWQHRTYLAYLPQPHIYEFVAESVGIYNGFKIGFGFPLALFDESPLVMAPSKGGLPALKPDFFNTVPLLLERLKKTCLEKIQKFSSVKQILYETAYNIKLNYMSAGIPTPLLDKMMFSKLREGLGGRAIYGFIGGALLNKDTEDFIYANFGMFKQAFGSTETCCAGTLGEFDYMKTGNVGPPTKCVELKFVAWQEGGYSPDDPQGPRGEIFLSGKTVSPGYYLNPEETKKSFVKDEQTGKIWYRTGDIGALLSDGTIKIIDRKKDIIKLKHGEYISLVHVENEILRSKLVDLVCVAPDADYGFLVALIMPNRMAVKEFCDQNEVKFETSDPEKLIQNVEVQELLQRNIRDFVAMGKKLDKYEMPKKFCIICDLWTPESGLMTPSAKIRRHVITTKYKENLM